MTKFPFSPVSAERSIDDVQVMTRDPMNHEFGLWIASPTALSTQIIPTDPDSIFWGAVAVAAAVTQWGTKRGGRKQWAVSGAELRYLVVLGAHAQYDPISKIRMCFTSQGTLAAKLGISRREAGRYEQSLARKGLLIMTRKPRRQGRFSVRTVEVRMNAPLGRAKADRGAGDDGEPEGHEAGSTSPHGGPLKAFDTK